MEKSGVRFFVYVGFEVRKPARVLNVLGQMRENFRVVKECHSRVDVGLDLLFFQPPSERLSLSCEFFAVD